MTSCKSTVHQRRCRLHGALALRPAGWPRREDILGEFMEYVARSPVISESSSVFVAYLGILTALAQGETGAEVRPECCQDQAAAAVPLQKESWFVSSRTEPLPERRVAERAGHVPAAAPRRCQRAGVLEPNVPRDEAVLRALRAAPGGPGAPFASVATPWVGLWVCVKGIRV